MVETGAAGSVEELRQREAITRVLADAGQRFLTYDHWQDVLPEVFPLLGQALGVSTVYILQAVKSNGVQVPRLLFEWINHEALINKVQQPRPTANPQQVFPPASEMVEDVRVFKGRLSQLPYAEQFPLLLGVRRGRRRLHVCRIPMGFFTNHSGGTKDRLRLDRADTSDEVFQPGGIVLAGGSFATVLVPDIVDTDEYHHHRWLMSKHILVQTLLQVGNLVATNTRSDAFDIQLVRLCLIGNQGYVTAFADSSRGDRVTQKDHPVTIGEFTDGREWSFSCGSCREGA